MVSAYVDRQLEGQPVETLLPMLKQHLDQCQICHEEYEIILELASTDAE